MRFKKHGPVTPYEETNRKRSAIARSQRQQREKAPLFADMIAAEQPTVDEEIAKRKDAWTQYQQERRDKRAANWRRARAKLATYSDNIRPTIRALWNEAPYPGNPAYLLDMMHGIDAGRIDVEHPPWRLTEEEIAAGRAAIASYEERQRARRAEQENQQKGSQL